MRRSQGGLRSIRTQRIFHQNLPYDGLGLHKEKVKKWLSGRAIVKFSAPKILFSIEFCVSLIFWRKISAGFVQINFTTKFQVKQSQGNNPSDNGSVKKLLSGKKIEKIGKKSIESSG